MAFTYDFPRPAVTVDCLVFRIKEGEVEMLLIKRKKGPYQDMWAFPGGFMEIEEAPEEAVVRELEEETGIIVGNIMQIAAFGAVDRDPRGRTVSIAYCAFLTGEQQAKAASDASDVKWFLLKQLPQLAFDHEKIVAYTQDLIGKKNFQLRIQKSLGISEEQAESLMHGVGPEKQE